MTGEQLKFIKFIIVVSVFGGAAKWIEYSISSNQLALAAREVEMKELEQTGKFISYAISENIGTRERFAHYFSRVTLSDERRALWNSYWQDIHPEYEELRRLAEKISQRLADQEAIQNKSLAVKAEIDALKVQLAEARKQLVVKPVLRIPDAAARNAPKTYDYLDYYNSGTGISGGDIIEFDAGGDTAGSPKSAWTRWLDWKEAAKATPNPCPKGYRQGATLTREMRTTGQPPRSEIRRQVECLDKPGYP